MAKKLPPPKKKSSPSTPPPLAEDEEEDMHSDSSGEERGGEKFLSKSSDDEEGDSGEDNSESETEQPTPNPPHFVPAAAATRTVPAPAASSDDSSDEGDDSGEEDSESEPEQPTPKPPHAAAATRTVPAPAAASDDSSDVGDDSGEEDSESEPEQPTPNPTHSAAAAAAIRTVPAPVAASDDSNDEGDDSRVEDSESEPELPTPNPPHSTAAAQTVPAPAHTWNDDDKEREEFGEDDLETEKEQPSAAHAATTGKPSNENLIPKSNGKDAATPSKKTTGEGEDARKLSQRIWSDEDQITLLKGMVDYMDIQGGNDPMANIEGFWSFIRVKLSFPVTVVQLMGKINTLKAKYRNNQKKNRAFTKAHETNVFELSKKLWEESMARENRRGKKRKIDELEEAGPVVKCSANDEVVDADRLEWENETVNLCMEHIGWSDEFTRAKIKSLAESERKSMVQNWKKLKMEQVSCFLNRISLQVETIATIFRRP